MRTAAAIAGLFFLLAGGEAQEESATTPGEPVLRNTGTPMRLPFQCTEEDIQAANLPCSPEAPCQAFLELSAVEAVGTRIFVAGNVHTGSTTIYSVLLSSDDGGKSWSEPHQRIHKAIFEQIQFLDFATGWIGGQTANLMPRDPFLLLTTNGGKTWRRRPVFQESRIGAIERFWFDTPKSGVLWVDRTQSGEAHSRYERYETMTGGESWMIREVTNRPVGEKLRAAAPPTPDWRLRPHAATQSYLLEARQGEAWREVASFQIRLGDCRPPERFLPEPPSDPEPLLEEPPSEPSPPRAPPTLRRDP
jgi:hypothetical protein